MGRKISQTSLASKINTLKKGESIIIPCSSSLQYMLNQIQAKRTQGYIPKTIICKKASCVVGDELIIGVLICNV